MADVIEGNVLEVSLTLVNSEKIKKEKLIPVKAYDGYKINDIFTDDRGSKIFFSDSSKLHLPCFVFDFKQKAILMETGEPARPSVVYKIRTHVYDISHVAKNAKAPFWVVAYLKALTSPFGRRSRVKMFYNAFVYQHDRKPHPDILYLMGRAELFSKAGFAIDIYNSDAKHYWDRDGSFLEQFKKSTSFMRKFSNLWTEPYSTDFTWDPKKHLSLSSYLTQYERLSNPTFCSFVEEGKRYNRAIWETLDSYYTSNFLTRLDMLCNTIGYDVKRLSKYLTNDLDYQGFNTEEIFNNMNLLHDYAKMTYDTLGNSKFTKYPSFLKTYHDIAAKNFRIKEDESLNAQFKEVVGDTLSRLPKINMKHKDYVVLVPQTMKEIITEGARQHHCVASYAKNVAKKETTILFMRYKSLPEDSLVTLEVRGLFDEDPAIPYISQAKGNSNRSVVPEEHEFLVEWAKKNGISYGRD